MSLKSELVRSRNFGTKQKETVFRVTKNDKKMIGPNDIIKMVKNIEKQAEKENQTAKLRLRGLNKVKWYTVKGMDEILDFDDFTDYFNNKVKEVKGFDDFFQMEFTILTTKNN